MLSTTAKRSLCTTAQRSSSRASNATHHYAGRWKVDYSSRIFSCHSRTSPRVALREGLQQSVPEKSLNNRYYSSGTSRFQQLHSSRDLAASSSTMHIPQTETCNVIGEQRTAGRKWRKHIRFKKGPRIRSHDGIFSFVLLDCFFPDSERPTGGATTTRRRFSSEPPPGKDVDISDETKNLLKQKLSEVAQHNVEDFVAGTLASTMNPIHEETAKMRRRHKESAILLDNDRDLYNQIAELQSLKKEAALQKTATNVYRALCGNVIICFAKFGAWASSGSSSMLSEFIHSIVDCGNQALLLVGLSNSRNSADRRHPYGYGKSVYFWALVSALGTFFLGAGVSMTHAIGDLLDPSLQTINWHVWGVLVVSFVVDGYVFMQTMSDVLETKPSDVSYWAHLKNIRDPATLAVLLEDGAACMGIVIALSGIALTSATGNPVFDGLAGVGISTLLGCMGLALVQVNHRFLLGQAIDRDITDGIRKILLSRRSIDGIGSVQSQWISSDTFSYKAEVDFDGTYLAARLMPIYQQEFLQIRDTMDSELQVLLALYAEDVMRTVEREVRHVEAQIRKKYPGAEYIELEPMSRFADQLAIYDDVEAELRRVESAALDKYLRSLKKEQVSRETKSRGTDSSIEQK